MVVARSDRISPGGCVLTDEKFSRLLIAFNGANVQPVEIALATSPRAPTSATPDEGKTASLLSYLKILSQPPILHSKSFRLLKLLCEEISGGGIQGRVCLASNSMEVQSKVKLEVYRGRKYSEVWEKALIGSLESISIIGRGVSQE